MKLIVTFHSFTIMPNNRTVIRILSVADGHQDGDIYKLQNGSIRLCHNLETAQRRTGGGGFNPPEIPKFWQSCIWLHIEQKMFSVPIPTS